MTDRSTVAERSLKIARQLAAHDIEVAEAAMQILDLAYSLALEEVKAVAGRMLAATTVNIKIGSEKDEDVAQCATAPRNPDAAA